MVAETADQERAGACDKSERDCRNGTRSSRRRYERKSKSGPRSVQHRSLLARGEMGQEEQPRWLEHSSSFMVQGFANALYDGMVVGLQELASRCIGLIRKPHDKTEDEAQKTTKTSSTTIDTQDGCGWVHERHGEEDQYRTTAGGLGFGGEDYTKVTVHQDYGRGRQGRTDRGAAFPSDKEVTARLTMQASGFLDQNDMDSEASAATKGCRRWTFPAAYTEGRHCPQHMTFKRR
ncbi:unnamed protein product [Vitrella brassicaformis CCMP3155]|uniref:Uncharacterized protein n=1 Tax=Vitrella brassicaformis (strain CCMP3155) TaxID=1169540 RepID=A0A0G4GGC8_VITBC|nr:unnamed protein product [Vitrella brassicaformis CCMP3155]|eukprot:CEM28673.1 unnamed protein product [Vitrella brassicaformis CCMP3155]